MKHIVGLVAIFMTLAVGEVMAEAQRAKKVPRIGCLSPLSTSAAQPA